MALSSIINFGNISSYSGGVNFFINEDGSYDISYCVLRRNKGMLTIVESEKNLTTITELEQKLTVILPAGAQLYINVQGRGILSKVVPKVEKLGEPVCYIREAFPMVDPDDFLCQTYFAASGAYVTVMRKESYSTIHNFFKNYSLQGISLGEFIVGVLSPVINIPFVAIPGARIDFADKLISSIQRSNQNPVFFSPVQISDFSIPAEVLLAYASACSSSLSSHELRTPGIVSLLDSRRAFTFRGHVYAAGKWALFSVLFALVINSLVYFWLQTELEDIRSQDVLFSEKNQEKTVAQKKNTKLIRAYETIGWKSNTEPVFYSDQIALCVMDDLQLTELELGTLDELTSRKEGRDIYNTHKIRIKGETGSAESFQAFVNSLERLAWVKLVIDRNYSFDSKLKKGFFEFYITIR